MPSDAPHNNLRISRIFKCLSELGLERLNAGFILHVLNEQSEHDRLLAPRGMCPSRHPLRLPKSDRHLPQVQLTSQELFTDYQNEQSRTTAPTILSVSTAVRTLLASRWTRCWHGVAGSGRGHPISCRLPRKPLRQSRLVS